MESYACLYLDRDLELKGDLSDPAWAEAPWSAPFVDIQGDKAPKPWFQTRMKMRWNERYLYIAADLEEPHLWATLTEHDSVIFHDNDFEVFIDPDGDNHHYAELELNALNTTWDLLLVRPYRDGGPPLDAYEMHGLKTAVHLRGTLNDPRDKDDGWSVEIAIPWKAFVQITPQPCPPKDLDVWRVNYSRVQWHLEVVDGKYRKVAGKPEENWVWSPQGVIDMHRPETWGFVQFVRTLADFTRPGPAPEEVRLMALYHAQRAFREKSGHWARSLADLKLPDPEGIDLQATDRQFSARLNGWTIDHESRLRSPGGEAFKRPE